MRYLADYHAFGKPEETAMGKQALKGLCLLIIALMLCACSGKTETDNVALPREPDEIWLPYEADGKWGYINTRGETIIEPVYEYAGWFSEGLAVFCEGGLYGYINRQNQAVIAPRYDGAGEFVNGYAVVCKGDWQSGTALWGYIDGSGREIVSPQFLYAESFTSEGRALVWAAQGEAIVKGFVNTEGEIFIPEDFEVCSGFSDGLALIRQNGLYGYINAEYGIAIQPQFNDAGCFGEGLAFAEKDGRRFMIDRTGNAAATVEYAFSAFSDGRAVIQKDDLYGYIDKEGKLAIEPRFAWAKDFCNGLAAVQTRMEDGGKWGFINTAGEMIIPAVYDEVENFREDYTRAYKYNDLTYYILDKAGRVIHSGRYSTGRKEQEAI